MELSARLAWADRLSCHEGTSLCTLPMLPERAQRKDGVKEGSNEKKKTNEGIESADPKKEARTMGPVL